MHSKFNRRRSFGSFLGKRYPDLQTVSGTIISNSDDNNVGLEGSGGILSGILTGPITITITEVRSPTRTIQISTSAAVTQSSTSSISNSDTSTTSQPSSTSTTLSIASTQTSSSFTSFFTTSRITAQPFPSASVTISNGTEPVSGSSSESSIPAGAIAGIVIACFLLIVASVLVVLRKRSVRNRVKLRGFWANKNSAAPLGISSDKYSFTTEPFPVAQPPSKPSPSWNIPQPRVPVPRFIATPPPTMPAALEGKPSSPGARRGSQLAVSRNSSPLLSPFGATVKYTFYTKLSDELNITVGERVRVLAEYDDGWGLCINNMGEQGVIPLECLDRGEPSISPAVLESRLSINARRGSSLPPPRSPVPDSKSPRL